MHSHRRQKLWLGPFTAVLMLLGSIIGASPAHADITKFGTTMLSGMGRATYEWTTPAPAASVYVVFRSSTTLGDEWAFEASVDVQSTAAGTIIFNPRSMIGASGCTMCLISKVSGPSNYLPNDVYATQMVFLNTTGTISRSPVGSFTTSSSVARRPSPIPRRSRTWARTA